MTDKEKEMFEHAEFILSCICHELGLAEIANDPYPVEDKYIEWMLSETEGLVYHNEEEWVYKSPTLSQAKNIVIAHED